MSGRFGVSVLDPLRDTRDEWEQEHRGEGWNDEGNGDHRDRSLSGKIPGSNYLSGDTPPESIFPRMTERVPEIPKPFLLLKSGVV